MILSTVINMNGTLILGIDYGYGNIKTAHRVFQTALIKSEKAPTFSKDYLEYDGYFPLSGKVIGALLLKSSQMKEVTVSYVQEIFQKLKDYEYNEREDTFADRIVKRVENYLKDNGEVQVSGSGDGMLQNGGEDETLVLKQSKLNIKRVLAS